MSILIPLISVIKEILPKVLSLRYHKMKKEDDSYVSKGDLLMDHTIMTWMKQHLPDHQIITEETYRSGTIDLRTTKYTVVVDPIDGTENFISGLKEWGCGICVYEGEQFLEALIALPELDQYLHSDDLPEHHIDSRIYGISSSLSKEDILNLETGFEYRIIGCCMYNMYNVINGSYKQFQNPKGARCWDILPGLNMARKKKLDVQVNDLPYHGEFLQPDKKYRFRITHV